ncbi:ROK family protein [Pedobacter sp. AW1-32]|uniref:ROK family protein n=1 Tax=Pedobacter sp. AW1-32 TaxID=3383026 RepID=UPI003FEFE4DF
MTNKYVLGVDIGGSHITVAVLDMENHSILKDSFTRIRVDSHGKPEQIVDAWGKTIAEGYQKVGLTVDKLGLAMPGPFDYETGVSYISGNDKFESLYGLNVKNMLAKVLNIESDNILIENDAACFLAGEVFAGAAKGYNRVIGITLGTGLGSASFIDGQANDEDLWRMPFLDGIAEDYISTRWFLKRYYEFSGLNVLDVKELAALYSDSGTAKKVFSEFSSNLAAFLKIFLQKTNAEAIVIGGNIANASDKFLPALLRHLKADNIQVPVLISVLNEHAAIAGAASCWHK